MQLYINSYGCYLHVRDAMFEVRVPSSEGSGYDKHQFAVSKVTSIVITTSGSLSTDAIQLALQNNIDIVFTDKTGFPLGRVWHSKLGSTTKIRKR
ncbi:CRISPR-associated endonuclease Cas1, partial [Arthrospira platensis SPKY2]